MPYAWQVSFEDKLKFCFDFYDLTGDEDVNKTEFLATFINANKGMSREEARQEVDKIFEQVFTYMDGLLATSVAGALSSEPKACH
jgi:Ca2+-binding EF-hand superfamily protein